MAATLALGRRTAGWSQAKVTQAELARVFAAREPTMPAFHLVSQSNESAVVEMRPSPALIYFDGHFDDAPILPGVVQIDWAIELGRGLFGFTGGFVQHGSAQVSSHFSTRPCHPPRT